MHRDWALAEEILGGSRRALRTFRRRYHDDIELVFEHYHESRMLGLDLETYAEGVATAAAAALVTSLPSSAEDADMSAHVTRVLRRRDFALSLLLRQGHAGAWAKFRDRFSRYLKSLFLRSGHSADEAVRLLDDLIGELREPHEDGGMALDDYHGRSDLTEWLFVYVRCRFKGGRRMMAPEGRAPAPGPRPAPDGAEIVDLAETRAALDAAFEATVEALPPRDRRLLYLVAHGVDLSRVGSEKLLGKGRESAGALLERHARLIERVSRDMVAGVAERLDKQPEAVEFTVNEALINDLSRELEQICGWRADRGIDA